MADRGTYGQPSPEGTSPGAAIGLFALALVGILVAPVVGIVGGAALAAAVSGRGGKRR